MSELVKASIKTLLVSNIPDIADNHFANIRLHEYN